MFLVNCNVKNYSNAGIAWSHSWKRTAEKSQGHCPSQDMSVLRRTLSLFGRLHLVIVLSQYIIQCLTSLANIITIQLLLLHAVLPCLFRLQLPESRSYDPHFLLRFATPLTFRPIDVFSFAYIKKTEHVFLQHSVTPVVSYGPTWPKSRWMQTHFMVLASVDHAN